MSPTGLGCVQGLPCPDTDRSGGFSPVSGHKGCAAALPLRRSSSIVSSCSLAPKKINLNVNSITFTPDRTRLHYKGGMSA